MHNSGLGPLTIMAKSRLAPIKAMTIPRLELAAAALAVKMDGALQRELDLKLEKSVFWTDSTIVLLLYQQRQQASVFKRTWQIGCPWFTPAL